MTTTPQLRPQTADEFVDAGPTETSAVSTTAVPPLGVAGDYVAQVERRGRRYAFGVRAPSYTVAVPPRYFERHVTEPASLAPEHVRQLKMALLRAGAYDDADEVRLNGIWDEHSQKAWARILSYANAAGITDREALKAWAAAEAEHRETTKQAVVVRLPNPADLRAVFKRASTETIGFVSNDAIDQMIGAYQNAVGNYQRQVAGMTSTGGTITEPPDPTAFAEEELTRLFPSEARASAFADTMAEFERLIGAGGS